MYHVEQRTDHAIINTTPYFVVPVPTEMVEYAPTAADIRDFVENLKAAARFDNPHLGEWWNIISRGKFSCLNSYQVFRGIIKRTKVLLIKLSSYSLDAHESRTCRNTNDQTLCRLPRHTFYDRGTKSSEPLHTNGLC